ncbi:MAG: hypothetical protein AB7O38_01750 [Pirellulaceae bacterium]
MNLKKMLVVSVVVLAGLGWTYKSMPALRARVVSEGQSWFGWTEAARQADPDGFTRHVERRLKEDLTKLEGSRRELAAEVGTLSRKIQEQQAMAEHAERLTEEFRGVYQTALENGRFPVAVREAAYTEGQVVSQVSLLLAQTEGFRETLDKLAVLRQKAESRLEELSVRIERTGSQLAMIATQRELLRVRVLTEEGERLVAQVDELLDGNVAVEQDNPVRNVEELLAASQSDQTYRPSLDKARQFLVSQRHASPANAAGFPATVELPKFDLEQSHIRPAQKPLFVQE